MQDHIEHYRVDLCAPRVDTRLASALIERGLAFIDGVPDPGSLLRLVRRFAVVVPHRDTVADGVTTLVDRGVAARSGRHGFTSRALPPHTDGAGLDDPPALLLMTCGQPATSGGECLLIHGAAVNGAALQRGTSGSAGSSPRRLRSTRMRSRLRPVR